jgi:hypothetical protein
MPVNFLAEISANNFVNSARNFWYSFLHFVAEYSVNKYIMIFLNFFLDFRFSLYASIEHFFSFVFFLIYFLICFRSLFLSLYFPDLTLLYHRKGMWLELIQLQLLEILVLRFSRCLF